jgi:hypothetical protein
MRQRAKKNDNIAWIRRHLAELVDRYPGQYAVVADGEVFVGRDPLSLEKRARKAHPGAKVTGIPIPRPGDIQCAL